MNNRAFGTIAGLERKHYGTGYGCEFEADGEPYSPDYAAVARACGAEGVTRRMRPNWSRNSRCLRLAPPDRARRPDAQHARGDAG